MIPSNIPLTPFIVILSACWGSFLNVLAYRLVCNQSVILPCSHCAQCKQSLVWYDMIPIFSWVWLRGHCRTCGTYISWLYPFIELISALLFSLLWYRIDSHYFVAYALFFSALIITIRTDLEHMLISRFATTFLIPLGITAAFTGFIPLTPVQSMLGTFCGYFFLFSIATLFKWFTNKEGMGAGDFDLMALIGSFTGLLGVWIAILIGSTLGSLVGLFFLVVLKKDRSFKIPFGLFLAGGAISYVLYAKIILSWLSI
jgi:leader peptidase (prepilin peptidase) / N-methyltransferase